MFLVKREESRDFDVFFGLFLGVFQIGSRLGPNHLAKTLERKVKRQKGYNSTWQDKHSLGLSTQTWHSAHKHMEDGIKQVEQRSKHTSM